MSETLPNSNEVETLNPEALKAFGAEAVEIQTQKKALADKIEQIQRRLMSGYSKPLDDYRIELLQEDIKLSCRLTDILTK